jgi:hypothetical protein
VFSQEFRREENRFVARIGAKIAYRIAPNKQALFLVFSNRTIRRTNRTNKNRRNEGLKCGGMELEGLTACNK